MKITKKPFLYALIILIVVLAIKPIKTSYRRYKITSEYNYLIHADVPEQLREKLEKIYNENDVDTMKNVVSMHRIFVKNLEKNLTTINENLKPKLLGLHEYTHADLVKRNQHIFQNSVNALMNDKKIYKIPHIHHRIWVTSDESPTEVSPELLKKYIDGLKIFPKDWVHIFWCMNPQKIPNTIKMLKESAVKVEIKSLDTLIEKMPGKVLLKKLMQEKYFAAVVDILKRYVVYKFGGLYSDIGIQWTVDPTIYLDKFDRIVCGSKYNDVSIDITYLAHAANQNAEKILFDVFEKFLTLPIDVKKEYEGAKILNVTWNKLAHYLLVTQMKESDKILIMRIDASYLQWKGMNSWRKGTAGNASIIKSTTQW
ncbi:MAG: hypothetical protein CNLJKLNK_00397 [Holosporales bacterium]